MWLHRERWRPLFFNLPAPSINRRTDAVLTLVRSGSARNSCRDHGMGRKYRAGYGISKVFGAPHKNYSLPNRNLKIIPEQLYLKLLKHIPWLLLKLGELLTWLSLWKSAVSLHKVSIAEMKCFIHSQKNVHSKLGHRIFARFSEKTSGKINDTYLAVELPDYFHVSHAELEKKEARKLKFLTIFFRHIPCAFQLSPLVKTIWPPTRDAWRDAKNARDIHASHATSRNRNYPLIIMIIIIGDYFIIIQNCSPRCPVRIT